MLVVILALVFVPTTWFDRMLEDDVNGFRSRIDDILHTNRDAPELEEKCGLLQADWEKHMEHWSFFLNHSAIEKVDLGICTFLEYVRCGNYENASIEAKRLDKIFEMTEHQDELSALNIF